MTATLSPATQLIRFHPKNTQCKWLNGHEKPNSLQNHSVWESPCVLPKLSSFKPTKPTPRCSSRNTRAAGRASALTACSTAFIPFSFHLEDCSRENRFSAPRGTCHIRRKHFVPVSLTDSHIPRAGASRQTAILNEQTIPIREERPESGKELLRWIIATTIKQ